MNKATSTGGFCFSVTEARSIGKRVPDGAKS